jgi:hypothetical protein
LWDIVSSACSARVSVYTWEHSRFNHQLRDQPRLRPIEAYHSYRWGNSSATSTATRLPLTFLRMTTLW